MFKEWVQATPPPAWVLEPLVRECGLHPLVAGILHRRGCETPEDVRTFLQVKLDGLRNQGIDDEIDIADNIKDDTTEL